MAMGNDMVSGNVPKTEPYFTCVCVGDSGRPRHRAAFRGSPQDLQRQSLYFAQRYQDEWWDLIPC